MAFKIDTSLVRQRVHGFLYIEGGLNARAKITVRGRMLPNVQQFAINLRVGAENGEDIALHFNPRVHQDTIVLNSFQCGAWQKEERQGPVDPFADEQEFSVTIKVHSSHYVISVNGKEFAKFVHRIQPNKVRYLQMGGGTECLEARITDNF